MSSLLTILGPTACGKTAFATRLAYDLGGEILSADSRQVYRGMDIGTGKDLADYTVNGKQIPYHLIDIADAGEKYNVYEFQHDFLEAYNDIVARGATPIMCGGTGLYLESVIRGYRLSPVPQNPELRERLAGKSLEELTEILCGYKQLHNTTDVDSAQRAIRAIEIESFNIEHPTPLRDLPPISSIIIGVSIDIARVIAMSERQRAFEVDVVVSGVEKRHAIGGILFDLFQILRELHTEIGHALC